MTASFDPIPVTDHPWSSGLRGHPACARCAMPKSVHVMDNIPTREDITAAWLIDPTFDVGAALARRSAALRGVELELGGISPELLKIAIETQAAHRGHRTGEPAPGCDWCLAAEIEQDVEDMLRYESDRMRCDDCGRDDGTHNENVEH